MRGMTVIPDRLAGDLGWSLAVMFRAYVKAADAATAGMPGGHRGYQVLCAAARDEPGSQAAMAQRLGIDRTVMTYLLDDLEAAKLVERQPDPADRRSRRVRRHRPRPGGPRRPGRALRPRRAAPAGRPGPRRSGGLQETAGRPRRPRQRPRPGPDGLRSGRRPHGPLAAQPLLAVIKAGADAILLIAQSAGSRPAATCTRRPKCLCCPSRRAHGAQPGAGLVSAGHLTPQRGQIPSTNGTW